jgi:GT2 family glycosyltransferase
MVHKGRNALVFNFLAHHVEADWLLFVDSDMTFQKELVDRLLAIADSDSRPVVAGLCFGGWSGSYVFPEMYRVSEEGTIGPIAEWEEGELLRVDSVGAGCLLVHRSVFLKLFLHYSESPVPFFAAVENHDEDEVFCSRLSEMGIPVYVDTSTILGHCKRTVIDESDYRRYFKKVSGDGNIEGILAGIVDKQRLKLRWQEGESTTFDLRTK